MASIQPLRILFLEDDEFDADLVCQFLGRKEVLINWVNNFHAFQKELEEGCFDLILSDYSLPDCNGLDVVQTAREKAPLVPFVLLTGTLGDELAIDILKAGASDYVLKSNLIRLKSAIPRALSEAHNLREKQKALEALRKSEERFELAVRGSGAGIWDWPDTANDNLWCSPRIYELLGYREGEIPITREQLYLLIHPDDCFSVRQATIDHLAGKKEYDIRYRIRHKDGHYLWWWSRGRAVASQGNKKRMAGHVVDITEWKRTEDDLWQQQKELLHAQKVGNLGSWSFEVPTGELILSPPIFRIFGLNDEEFDGQVECLLDSIFQEDMPVVKRNWQLALLKGFCDCQFRFIAGGDIKWGRLVAELAYDEKKRPIKAFGIFHDCTEQFKAEEKQKILQDQLLQAQKMEALGTLASGIAHDFNNILGVILGYGHLLRQRFEDAEVREEIDEILQATARGQHLIGQILTFSRKKTIEKQPVYIEVVIKEILGLLRGSIPKSIKIVPILNQEFPPVFGDSTQILQVLMNLCTNAFHAMPNGGTLTLAMENRSIGKENSLELNPGKYVELSVIDTGEGIPSEIIDRVFDPYFTTKDIDTGTGLGLSVAQGIISEMHGRISVASRPGQGSCFTILFPCCDKDAAMESSDEAV